MDHLCLQGPKKSELQSLLARQDHNPLWATVMAHHNYLRRINLLHVTCTSKQGDGGAWMAALDRWQPRTCTRHDDREFTVGQAKAVQLHPFDDAEALAWLGGRGSGSSVETSVTELARKFGWPPTRMRRRLDTWIKAGQITKNPTRNGKFTVVPSADLLAIDRIPDGQSAIRIVGRAFGDSAFGCYQ